MEDDLSENENDSNFGDDNSSTEDDMIRATVSYDGDSDEGDDDSGGESENSDNDLAHESIFIKTKSGHLTKLQHSSFHIDKNLITIGHGQLV